MLAHVDAVDPHVGQVVHGPEPQQVAALSVRIGRRGEIPPVPGHAVMAGEDFLNDPRDRGRLRAGDRLLPPFLLPADVLGIGARSQVPSKGTTRLDFAPASGSAAVPGAAASKAGQTTARRLQATGMVRRVVMIVLRVRYRRDACSTV